MAKEDRKKIVDYTRYLTVILAFMQSIGVSFGFRSAFVSDSFGSIALIALTLTAGTACLMWIGELITEKGIGNGISLIIFAGIVSRLPHGLFTLYNFVVERGAMGFLIVLLFAVIALAAIVAVVAIQEGQRRIPAVSYTHLDVYKRQIENITKVFGLPAVVAINRFPTDTEAELQLIYDNCKELGVNVALSEVWGKGSEGGKDLAAEVVRLATGSSAKLQYSYDVNDSIMDKIHAIVTKVYHGAGVDYAPAAKKAVSYTHLDVYKRQLLVQAKAGDEAARERIINCNLRLVFNLIQRFANRDCEMEDLFQIGVIGLMKAIDKFDSSYGVRFSTYAVPMIIGEIRRFLRDDGPIKISRSLKETGIRIRYTQEQLTKELGREPKLSEVAEKLELTPEQLTEALEATQYLTSIHEELYLSLIHIYRILSNCECHK